MKLLSWNVNGIRAASSKGFLKWFEDEKADAVCLQETKANEDQLDFFLKNPLGYTSVFHSAEKAGYSGVAIYTKKEPKNVIVGMGVKEIDSEGRVLQVDMGEFMLINAYFPNSQREHTRLGYKLKFCDEMLKLCKGYVKKGKNIILCGDYNIAHQEIDLANPKTNTKNAGFLPEEREWMTKYLSSGFVDIFRNFEKGNGHYTWWSYRPGVREKNVGWRIDYHTLNEDFQDRVKKVYHQDHIHGSDHCPIGLELRK